MKIAAEFILKATDEELDLFEDCLASIAAHVDGVFINLNLNKKIPAKVSSRLKNILAQYPIHSMVIESKWTGNFVKARNAIHNIIPQEYDFILWLDADDVVENPEKIKQVAAIATDSIDGIFIKYNYSTDAYGNVTVAHYVARLVRNNGSFAWKSSFSDSEVTVHETLNQTRSVKKAMNDEFWVTHHTTDDRQDASLERNIKLLESMLDKSKDNPDPRILYYLATHYIDANKLLEAKELFEQYLQVSGWAEERSQAWVYLGMVYDAYGDKDKARGCFMRALAENPNDPNPYIELGELEITEQMWQKAIYWLEIGANIKQDVTSTVVRPMDNTYRAYKLLSEAYANIGGDKLEDASKWLTKAIELRPFEPELIAAREQLDELTSIKELTRSAVLIVGELKKSGSTDRILPFVNSLPDRLQDNPFVAGARNHYSEPKVWPSKSIVIIAGWGPLGNWGPDSLNTSGLGGSEEAIIRIAPELVKLGYAVTVFGTPGNQAGVHEGVDWRHYWEFNPADQLDILVYWRNPDYFDKKPNARKSYLWVHDVIEREEFTEQRIANIDKIMFLTNYHRSLYPFIPDEKVFITANGITPEDFDKEDDKHERDNHRMIYTSSHVRGLQILYDAWPDIKKEVPDATLDVYYGWESYDAVNKDNPERMEWKHRMQAKEQGLDGVTDHGRVGQQQIVQEVFKSGVWAYPCFFPETYCITAVKAQAGGATPVATSFAALNEMVQFGTKINIATNENGDTGLWTEEKIEEYKQTLIQALKNPQADNERKTMMAETRNNNSWANTAKGWTENFGE